jgi:gliding motility-associated-like protein
VVDPPLLVLNKQVFVNNPTDVILLDASASAGQNLAFNWRSAGDGLIIAGSQTATPQVSGLGKYYVEITDEFGCTARDSVTVRLLVQVTALDDTIGVRVNTYADINVLRNDKPQGQLDPESISIVSPPSHGFATISSDSTITYTPDQYYVGHDEFIYAVCDYSNRCDEATVLVRVSDEALFVPNAFSPNGDGINDYFEIVGIGSYERVKMKIFNRWGNLVYESGNYGPGGDGFWDGKATLSIRTGDGQLGTGTYYYILDLGRANEKLSGFIYLDR